MTIAKQIDIRSNIKKYFDMAYGGDTIIVPRKENKNVVIISEEEYKRLSQKNRMTAYADLYNSGIFEPGRTVSIKGSVKEDNLNKLEIIRRLKGDWNGNGAEVFPRTLVGKVVEIIDNLAIQPELFPTALGTIQLEYDNARQDHMEIEIGEGESAEVFIASYDGTERYETIEASFRAINEKVSEFYG